MTYKHYICSLLFIILHFACDDNNRVNQPTETGKNDLTITGSKDDSKGLGIEPTLKQADSLQILYYDNPDGDPLRYTRYYQYLSSNDSAIIDTLLSNLNKPFEQLSKVKNCRSEGKMYVYGKKEPIKTIYFSTRCDTCCYLYFIKDGNFLYFPLSADMSSTLDRNKINSQKP